MADLVQLNEATASKRRMYFYLVDATDGLTPETGEASGQPQISTNGGAFTNTGIGTLTHMGNGQYYADLTQAAVNGSVGDKILGRYKSANTAEAPSLNAYTVVTLDPHAQDVNVADIDAAAITEILDTDATGSKTKHTVGGLLWQASHGLMITDGTAQAGGASTITLDAGSSAVDNFYRGCHICIEDGTGTGQGRVILSYNGTTKVATVDEAWATQPDGTSEYVITHDRSLSTVAALEDAAVDEIWAGEGGTGSSQLTVNVKVGGSNIANVQVAVWDSANTTFVTKKTTNASGNAVFALADAGYKVRLWKSGYSFTVPESVTVSGATSANLTGSAVSSTVTSTDYEARPLRRQKIRYNDDNDDNLVKYQLILGGEKITPDSATITIYKPGSTTAVLSATAMTVSGTLMTYAIDTTTTANYPVATGYRADLAVTYDGTVYKAHLVFDVVKYLLDMNIGRDQLLALDDAIEDTDHAGDEDFSELIEACRDIFQAKLESKVLSGNGLIESMVLDSSRVAVAARFYILGQIWHNKGDTERRDYYMEQYESLWDAVLSTLKFDTTQDGEENAELGGGLQEVRIKT